MQDGTKPSCHDHKLVQITAPEERLDLGAVREKLAASRGPRFWRSLEELAQTPQFEDMLHREFPRHASEWRDGEKGFSRRDFLKLSGASLAFAGLIGCTKQPLEPIVPYVKQPEELVLGKPLFFATAMTLSGYGKPLLVESHEGRPTKIEGNPDHPASRGAADLYAQASILSMYDPERSQTILNQGEVRPWGSLVSALKRALAAQRGAGIRILTGAVSSPTLAAQIQGILQTYPGAKWHQWEANNRDSAYRGMAMAFGGGAIEAHYHLDKADVVLTLDADFMSAAGHPDFMRMSHDFMSRRRDPGKGMSRLYALESFPTNSGGKADHRLPVRASGVEQLAQAIAAEFGVASVLPVPEAVERNWTYTLVKDLQSARGKSVVIPGEQQAPEVHALAHAMNQALGNVGTTVMYAPPALENWVDNTASIAELVRDMQAGQVGVLLILGGNPVYDAPADFGFAEALKRVGLKIHLGLYVDETAAACDWHVPEAHFLEQWSDVRSFDGTISIVQPLILPLFAGRSAHQMLAALTDNPEQSGYDIVRAYWKAQNKSGDFEATWRRWLHDGLIPNTASPASQVSARKLELPAESKPAAQGTEIIFRPDPTIYDGRFAQNGWLQELQKTITTLTWENAVMVSPAMAQRDGLAYGDIVEIEYSGKKVKGPVYILPGHPQDAVTVHFGYGRQVAGATGSGEGFNAYPLRTSNAPWFGGGVTLRKTGEKQVLSTVRNHHVMNIQKIGEEAEAREVVRSATLEEFRKNPNFAHGDEPSEHMTMYPAFHYEGYAWGMAIDLTSCIGCNSCVVACQAENNIPVVGREQVIKSREMHWLRVDAYYEGDADNPKLYFQPVPCMHCENAPCEMVCPVGATVHSSEGLNDMVYNRCVGTRYCSNNCPYKVRRFNFLLFQDWDTPSLKLMRNPDVSVRSRGVMEKCTYCVQRINAGRIQAETEDRKVRDGEIVPACQQTCPTGAIVFGDLNDKKSRVAALRADSRNYGLLAELNTRPRTTYMAEVRNPNPELHQSPVTHEEHK